MQHIDSIIRVLGLLILLIGGIYVGIWVTMTVKFCIHSIRSKYRRKYRSKCQEAKRYNDYWESASYEYNHLRDKLEWERNNHEAIQNVLKEEIEKREKIIAMQKDRLDTLNNLINWDTMEKKTIIQLTKQEEK